MLWRMSADTLTETSATMSICQHTGDGQLQSRHDKTRAHLGPASILSAAEPYSGTHVLSGRAPESISTRSFLPPRQTASWVAGIAETPENPRDVEHRSRSGINYSGNRFLLQVPFGSARKSFKNRSAILTYSEAHAL